MGTSTTVKTNETQSNAPPTWAQPGLEELGGRVTSIIPTVPGQLYQGDFVAQPNGYDLATPGAYAGSANLANSLTPAALQNLFAAGGQTGYDSYGGAGLGGFQGFQNYTPTNVSMPGFNGFNGYQTLGPDTSNYGGFNGYTAPGAADLGGLAFGGFGGPSLNLNFGGSPGLGSASGASSFGGGGTQSGASFDYSTPGGTSFNGMAGPAVGSFADYDASAISPVIAAATAPILRQLQESILPSLRSSAVESGAYGSTRMDNVLPSMTMAQVGRNAQELGIQTAYQDFSDMENRKQSAFGLGTQRGLGELAAQNQAYQASTGRGLGLGQLANQAFGLETERGLGVSANEIAAAGVNNQAYDAFTNRVLGAGGLELGAFNAGTGRGQTTLDALLRGGQQNIDAYQAGTTRGLGEQNIGQGYSAQGLDAFGRSTERGLGELGIDLGRLGVQNDQFQSSTSRGMGELDAMLRQAGIGLEGYNAATQRGVNDYNAQTNRFDTIPQLLQSIMQMSTGAADLTAGAGASARSNEQMAIENALAQFDYSVRAPFQGLDIAAALLGNLAAPWGTRTTQGTQTQSSGGLGQVLQAAMGIGGMAMGMPGFSSMFKPSASGGLGAAGGR